MSKYKITYLESLVEDNGKVVPNIKSVYYCTDNKRYFQRVESWKKRSCVCFKKKANMLISYCLELTKNNEFKIRKLISCKLG